MNDLLTQLKIDWPGQVWQDVPVVVAVSGGADSVAMLLALLACCDPQRASAGLVVAHFDHRLRSGSHLDAQFVSELAETHGLRCISGTADAPLAADENAARNARYRFLAAAAAQAGARYLAVAHTSDDQLETVLHRIVRGTGVRGLAGMSRVRRLNELTTLVRPLLSCTREQVEHFLRLRSQSWRDDPTNAGNNFTRNRIRNQLRPLLEQEFNPQVRAAILRLAHHAATAQAVLNESVDVIWDEAVVELQRRANGASCTIRVTAMRHLGMAAMIALLQRVWAEMGLAEQGMDAVAWERACEAAWGPTSVAPQELPGKVRLERVGDWLRVTSAGKA